MKRQLVFGGVAAGVVLLVGSGAILLRSMHPTPAAVQSPTPTPLAIAGPFTCADQIGGRGGKDFNSPPLLKSLAVEHQDGVDRLIFEFAPGPGGSDGLPLYSVTQRLEPQFIHNDPQQIVTLSGSTGVDLDFSNLAATHGYWQFRAMPSRLLHTLGPVDYATDLSAVREVALLGYFDPAAGSATATVATPSHWGIGLAARACFRVTELSHPARLVIDFDTAHPAPSPGPFALTQIQDASFVDASHGWVLGAGCAPGIQECRLLIERTLDGGQHWVGSAAPALPIGGTGGWHLRFATAQDGWLYGLQLYATHDGGQSWSLVRSSPIASLAVVGQSVWALEGGCSSPSPSPCSLSMVRSTDAGHSWSAVSIPQIDRAGLATVARADSLHGWILAWGIEAQPSATLVRTIDGGATWQTLAAPCTPSYGPSGGLGSSSPSDVWAVCGGVPGAGQQLKQLARSVDGGSHWTISDLSSSGYVSDLAVTSASRAWLAFGRGPLSTTVDGGRTWRTSIDNNEAGMDFVRFNDPLHGWAATSQQLYRTTDGGLHWAPALTAGSG